MPDPVCPYAIIHTLYLLIKKTTYAHNTMHEVPDDCGSRVLFHYVTPTRQRPVGLTKKNGTTFSDKTGPTERNGSNHFLLLSSIPHIGEIY